MADLDPNKKVINTSKWFEYEYPLKSVAGAPTPSQANYNPKNIAPLIESFASMLGVRKEQLQFVYENNNPNNVNTNIEISHPGDTLYLDKHLGKNSEKSPSMARYELFAKRSTRLLSFKDQSPASIDYFQD